jgi:putative membrane protein
MRLTCGEWTIAIFTATYVAAFLAYFILIADQEFIGYLATMVILVGIVAWSHQLMRFPMSLLWALTFWGLAHMAGGSLQLGGTVLYNLLLIPIAGEAELRILKYDQLVHFYGFAVTAWMLWFILQKQVPQLRRSMTVYAFPALASMGLGAANEIVEFSAVMLVPHTNVGGYYNTALDLVFNALGAIFAMLVCAAWERAQARSPR